MRFFKNFQTLIFVLCFCAPSFAQLGISTDGADPNSSSMLDIKSTDKGVLIPRMTEAQRDIISVSAAEEGLMIYQTDETKGFYYYDGSAWQEMGESSGGGNSEVLIIKPSDQTNSTTTLANDNHFTFNLEANSSYLFIGFLIFEGNDSEAKVGWDYTGTMNLAAYGLTGSGSTLLITGLGESGKILINSNPNPHDWKGTFQTTTAGTLTFQFARFEDDGDGCTMKTGSFMVFTKMN